MSQKRIKQERRKLESIFDGMENLSPERMNQFLKNIVKVEEKTKAKK